MKKTVKLGDLFSTDNVLEFVSAEPTPFDFEASDRLFRESEARRLKEQKFNSARNYRKLFTRLTGKDIDLDVEMTFGILERQYGKTMILETMEYMATKNTKWKEPQFMAYLLKALQGTRRDLELEYATRNPEDDYLAALDKSINRQTKRHIMEIRKWEREHIYAHVPIVVEKSK